MNIFIIEPVVRWPQGRRESRWLQASGSGIRREKINQPGSLRMRNHG